MKSLNRLFPSSLTKLALATLLVATGPVYFYTASADDPAGAAPAAPVPQVEVAALAPTEIRAWHQFSGRLAAVESANIKPLVSGTIQQVLFTEGEWVDKGAALFVIDPRPYQAAVASAEAQLVSARSQARLTKDELARADQLRQSKLISESLYDSAASAAQIAQAAIKNAESVLTQAQLSLEYAHVEAPISGRVSRAELTVGNVVEAGSSAPVLTTIVADDQFYAEFSVSESVYLQAVRSALDADDQTMPVELTLAEDGGTTYHGHIHSFDNHLDTASGTIRARALIDNADGALMAGMYANVQLGSAQKTEALLVPERAIGTNQSHKFVYVIDDANTVQYREITLGEEYEGHRIVTQGIAAGEHVVVNGLSHITPNSKVDPVVVEQELNAVAAR